MKELYEGPQSFTPLDGFVALSWLLALRVASPQLVRSSANRSVQSISYAVQVFVEQVGICVERHGRPGVPEHPLDCFDVGPSADGETGGRVAEVMGGDRREGAVGRLAFLDCRLKHSRPPVAVAQDRTPLISEYQTATVLPDHERCHLFGQHGGERHRSPLMRLRRAPLLEHARKSGRKFGRPAKLNAEEAALARRMKSNGETVATICRALGIGRTALYRYLAEDETA